ncbi:MAG TPA: GGDEF domain-containing protein [Limnochordales bacterium]
MMRRREAAYGFLVGSAVGVGLLSAGWLIEVGTQRDVLRWLPVVYVGLLAVAGAVGASWWAELKEQAMTDPLTGLFNRRYFLSVLDKYIAQVRRSGGRVSLLILDVDNFKRINDRFGHPEGDRVLRQVAGAIVAASRRSDVVARWGGEEFAIILPDTDAHGAQCAARRIARAVEAATGISLSVGWATFPDEEEGALLTRADERMYRHKRDKDSGA